MAQQRKQPRAQQRDAQTSSLGRRWSRFRKRNRPEVLYTFSFPTQAEHPRASGDGYRLVEADEEMLGQLRARYPRQLSDHKHRLLVDRLSSPNERCWVIVDDAGELCGYCHVALSDTVNTRINHPVKVGPRQAYFFDDYVFTQHRGRGLHAFSIARRLEIAAGMGITEGLTTITKTNTGSLVSYGKFDLRPGATLVYLPPLRRTLTLPRRGLAGR